MEIIEAISGYYKRATLDREVILVLLLCALAELSFAQYPPNLRFEHLGIEDGLSQVTAKCILQDKQGYIWIGTQDGLNRFDGYSFKVFRHDPEDSSSLSSSLINCLIEDSHGRLVIGTEEGLNYFDAKTETFEGVLDYSDRPNALSDNKVTSLLEDNAGVLWVGTNHGLHLLDGINSGSQKYHDPIFQSSLSDNRVTTLFEDKQGHLWIGTENGLNFYNGQSEDFISYYHDPDDLFSLSSDQITTIQEDDMGRLWVGTKLGLNLFDEQNRTFTRYLDDTKSRPFGAIEVAALLQDDNQHFWIGTVDSGLLLYDPSDQTFTSYRHDSNDPFSLSNNAVWSITQDKTGNLWVGVANKGINFHDPRTQTLTHFRHQPNNNISLVDDAVRGILLDSADRLWVGSFAGLTVIDRAKNQSKIYRHDPNDPSSPSGNYVRSVYQDRSGQIWLGTSAGLDCYDQHSDHFTPLKVDEEEPLFGMTIGPILEDNTGDLWVSAQQIGLFRIDEAKTTIQKYAPGSTEAVGVPIINCVLEDSKNRLWVGTGKGLYLFDPEKDEFVRFVQKEGAIDNDNIMTIAEGLDGSIWVGTIAGLYRIDTETFTVKGYREKDGLSNDVIYGALADDSGFIWLSTNKGINRFDPATGVFTVFDKADGLQSNEFNGRAYYKDTEGYLYFGGVNGLSIFHPDNVSQNAFLPSVVLTDFLVFNKSVDIGDSTVLIKAINHMDEIALEYDQDMFAFEFSALNYIQSEKNQFAYKLEPFNEDWIYTSSDDRKATFTRIPPGTYTFSVKASNDDGLWNEEAKSINIKILPPWWRTWWAISLYIILSLVAILLIARFQWRRIQLKNRLKLEQQGAEQLKALDQLKTQFFSNITHEFRTPLTLIIGPSEQILDQPKLDESFTRTQVEMVLRNSRKFLHLVNQLLDLSKLEGNQMSLDLYQGDFSAFVKKIVEQFDNAAKQKKVRLGFHSKLPVNDYLFDLDKIDKILFNLLSNALKFTPQDGTIQVNLQVKEGTEEKVHSIVIVVEDSGIGIPPDQLDQVFDRFYQVDNSTKKEHEGTGIGLALTKELIEVHGGTIKAISEQGKGTVFTISLPLQVATAESSSKVSEEIDETLLTSLAYSTLNEPIASNGKDEVIDPEANQPIVLIIEDNNDLREFIKSVIARNYQTITAKDGAEGIEMALKYIPDLIISDVMMPQKDGYEVTRALKNNPLSSHVPIILLTAKSTLKSRVAGLEEGADAYLTKPFSVEELMLVSNRQIETRKILQAKFAKPSLESTDKSTYRKIDQKLLDRLHDFIEANLSNEKLVVDELVKEAAMSHSQLYRKIKALTDMSIASFIRNYRLTRALELLELGEHNVTEVADMTGFGDRRYFHKAFVDRFDYPPSQVLKN